MASMNDDYRPHPELIVAQSWVGIDQDGDLRHWFPDEITDWTPARVVTDEADR